MKQLIIDSHIHLDIVAADFPDRIPWLEAHGIVPVSWSFNKRIESMEELRNSLQRQVSFIHSINSDSFPCRFLAGIHPRNIPPDLKSSDVTELLMPFLKDPLCLGLGEIGLETGDPHEVQILTAQLALKDTIDSLHKKIGIHTPRKNKASITKKILDLLQNFNGIEPVTVIDHCSLETIGRVLERGFHAGVTLSTEKTSVDELKRIIVVFNGGLDRIMCNTDSGMSFSEDLYRFSTDPSVSPEIQRALLFDNAFRFFSPFQIPA